MILVILYFALPVDGRNSSIILAFGDWGMETYDFRMGAERLGMVNATTTILLGDNLYDNGVKSADDPLWDLFHDIRNTSDEFYAIVGNHDYIYSAQAQVTYSKADPKWVMPALYYYSRLNTSDESGTYICGVFLDSYKFDDTQLRWSRVILSSGECQSEKAYRIVFSHHPIHTVGIFQESDIVKQLNAEMKPVLEEYRVHAFVAGHEHDMEVFYDNGVTYLISGAFSDKYSRYSETNNDTSLVWRNLGTAGFLQFHPNNMHVRYDFVSSASGESLFNGTINQSNNWVVASVSQNDNYTPSLTFANLVCIFHLMRLFI